MPIEDINMHMGWSYDSNMFKTYFRHVVAQQMDYDFYVDILPKSIVFAWSTLNIGHKVL